MSTTSVSQYGIANVTEKFSGNDPTKYPTWKAEAINCLLSLGITLPVDRASAWFEHNEHAYATTAAEHIPIVIPSANQVLTGYVAGDLALKPENRRLSEEDKEKKTVKRNKAISSVRAWIVPGSQAYARIKTGMDAKDFRIMWADLDDFYDAKDMATLMAHATKQMKFFKILDTRSPQSFSTHTISLYSTMTLSPE